jgi:two-component system nitrate/nitrite response regulator NarL
MTPRITLALLHPSMLSRDALSRALEDSNVEVVARDPDQRAFVEHVRDRKPDVALVDLDEDDAGRRLVGELAEERPATAVLVISSGDGAAGGFRSAGAAGYLDRDHQGLGAALDAVRAVAGGKHFFAEPLGSPPPEPVLERLSTREHEVLTFVAACAGNRAIAFALHISERTVKAHVSSLYRKLGQENRTQLALFARAIGLRRERI